MKELLILNTNSLACMLSLPPILPPLGNKKIKTPSRSASYRIV